MDAGCKFNAQGTGWRGVYSWLSFLKGNYTEAKKEYQEQVRASVAKILSDIESRGDAAVRELSERFDNWSPASFRLTKEQIEEVIAQVPIQVQEDIKFAQAQIRNFAQHQLASIQDIEVETFPGVTLGHRNIPVNRGCYIPGGYTPWWPLPI